MQRVTKRGVGSARWRLAFLEVAQGVLAITPDLELEPCQRVALQGCQASTELSDDRRYLLKLRLHNAKKPLVFQAPNDYERQQWVRFWQMFWGLGVSCSAFSFTCISICPLFYR